MASRLLCYCERAINDLLEPPLKTPSFVHDFLLFAALASLAGCGGDSSAQTPSQMLQDTARAMRDITSQLTTCGLSSDNAATLNRVVSKAESYASCAGPVLDLHAAEVQGPTSCVRNAMVAGRDCTANASCNSSKLNDCGNRGLSSLNNCKSISGAIQSEIDSACGQSSGQGNGQGSAQAAVSAALDPLETFDDLIEAFVSVW
jgi:hypothetical protein